MSPSSFFKCRPSECTKGCPLLDEGRILNMIICPEFEFFFFCPRMSLVLMRLHIKTTYKKLAKLPNYFLYQPMKNKNQNYCSCCLVVEVIE